MPVGAPKPPVYLARPPVPAAVPPAAFVRSATVLGVNFAWPRAGSLMLCVANAGAAVATVVALAWPSWVAGLGPLNGGKNGFRSSTGKNALPSVDDCVGPFELFVAAESSADNGGNRSHVGSSICGGSKSNESSDGGSGALGVDSALSAVVASVGGNKSTDGSVGRSVWVFAWLWLVGFVVAGVGTVENGSVVRSVASVVLCGESVVVASSSAAVVGITLPNAMREIIGAEADDRSWSSSVVIDDDSVVVQSMPSFVG